MLKAHYQLKEKFQMNKEEKELLIACARAYTHIDYAESYGLNYDKEILTLSRGVIDATEIENFEEVFIDICTRLKKSFKMDATIAQQLVISQLAFLSRENKIKTQKFLDEISAALNLMQRKSAGELLPQLSRLLEVQ